MLSRLLLKSAKKVAARPGTIEYHGEKKTDRVRMDVIDYHTDHHTEAEDASLEQVLEYHGKPNPTWINVTGLHEADIVRRIGERFAIHPLVLEDVVNTSQRPKLEEYEDYIYIVVRMIQWSAENREVTSEQLSIIASANFIITFQEVPGDVFDGVRERIRNARGRIRNARTDYLLYALLDAVVDGYFVVLENLSIASESLEEEAMESAEKDLVQRIHEMRRAIVFTRNSISPVRDVLSTLTRDDIGFVDEKTVVFLRDVHDHTINAIEISGALRELIGGVHELYLSSVSNRMNEVMKVLTIVATVFVPVTFVAGIYGMNFEFMPELGWRWAYPAFWVVVAGMVGSMLLYFHRKDWL
jgi:magnesium transporter